METSWGQYAVWQGSGSEDYYEPGPNAYYADTEKEAVDLAFKMHDECAYVEYGVQPITIEEQKLALRMTIKDLQARLQRLWLTGSQYEKSQG
jgi:hypothetical protein